MQFFAEQIDKFGAGGVALHKQPREGRRGGARFLFLDAAHHHTHMLRLDNHRHAKRVQRLLNAVFDLVGEPFLNLQAARVGIDNAGNLAQARYVAVWNVGHVRLAEERQHMVLAEREHLYVLDNHHLRVLLFEHRALENGFRVLIVTLCQKLHSLCNAFGRFFQPLAVRVFAQIGDNLTVKVGQRLRLGVVVVVVALVAVVVDFF